MYQKSNKFLVRKVRKQKKIDQTSFLCIYDAIAPVQLHYREVFADRNLLSMIHQKNYTRYGVGAYERVVAHSTATPEAPAINIQKYESRTWRSAFVHYAVDWNETIQIADTKYIAYGAGPGANKRFVHVELCETRDEKFKRSYDKYVKLLRNFARSRIICRKRIMDSL